MTDVRIDGGRVPGLPAEATGVGPAGVGTSGASAAGVGASGTSASGVGPAGVGTSGTSATGAAGVGATGTSASSVGATGAARPGLEGRPGLVSLVSSDGAFVCEGDSCFVPGAEGAWSEVPD